MPEAVIQRADQYQADKYNKGVLTPDKSAAMVASPGIYNHALVSMYNDKYSSSFEDFDKFKTAYQSQYGDPFKKKEPSATSSPTKKVQSFQTSEPRTTTPLNEALKDAANQPQELPSENYVTPSEGPQVATFQTGGDRKQIPIEDAQKPLSLDAKQQEMDAKLSAQNSKGLITNATPEQQKNLDTSNALQARNAADATDPAYMEYYKQPSQSTSTAALPLTAEEEGSYGQPYSALENAIDYTKIAARQITGVIPGMIEVRNIAQQYAWEKVSGNPGAYTQEERDAAFNNATLAEKVFAYASGERATAAYNEFEKNYLTGSKANEESEAGAYASAVGQIIPMFVTGGASVGIKATQVAFKGASALNKAKFLVNGAGKLIVETSKSPSTYIAAQQIFNDTFQEAYKATGDSDKAMLAAGVNTVASAGLEALPFLNFTKRLDNMTGGTVKKVLISGGVGGAAEIVTEVAQTWTGNLVASNIYDETRKLTDGLIQSGEIGGVVGFTLSAVMASLHIRLKNSTDPYERQEIQKSIDEIAPKAVEAKKQENILANAVENEAVVQKNVEVQKVLSDDNISTQTIVEASQLRAEMPNYDEVKHKTVGLENKINILMVEKNGLYDKVDGSGNVNEQTKAADARSKAIDKEIRVISNQISDVYAQPSKEIVDQETTSEVDNATSTEASSDDASVSKVSGIANEVEVATTEQTQEYKQRGFEQNDNGIWIHKGTNPAIKKILNGWIGKLFSFNGGTHAGSIHKEGDGIAGSLGKFNFKTGKTSFLDLVFGKDKTDSDYFVTLSHEMGHNIFEKLNSAEKLIIEQNQSLTDSAKAHKENRDSKSKLENNASDAEESWSDYVSVYLAKQLFNTSQSEYEDIPKNILPILEANVKIPKDIIYDIAIDSQIKENNTENTKEDGTQQNPIDTNTANQGAETSSNETIAPKVAEQKTKVAGRGKTPLDKRNVNNPDILSALSHNTSDVEDITLQSFVRGEIAPTKEVYNELYANSSGDKKAAIGIIRTPEKGGKTLDQMAQKLWETQPNTDQYSTTDFKNAIINTIKSNSSKLSAAIKLNVKFNAPIEVDGKRVNSSGEQLHETPHGWMTQGSIDDFAATEEFKKDVSVDDYNEVMQEYDNLSDEEFHKLFTESQSDEKTTIADKSETVPIKKDWTETDFNALSKEEGINKVGSDLYIGPKADISELIEKHGNFVVRVKDANGYSAELPANEYAEMIKNKTFSDRVKQVSFAFGGRNQGLPSGFMSDIRKGNELVLTDGDISDNLNLPTGTELVSKSTVNPQKAKEIISTINNSDVQELIQNLRIKKIVIEKPGALGLSEQGNYHSQSKTLTLSADLDTPLQTILHEIGHDRFDNLSEKNKAELRDIARKDKRTTYEQNLDEFIVDNFYQGNNYFKSIKETKADLSIRLKQDQIKDNTTLNTQEKATTEKETQIQRDSVDLTQGEFEAKYPEEDYETTQLYATKDTEVAMEANKKSENPENFVMYANGFNIPFTMGNIPAKIKAGWIKTFQKGAGIPYQLVYEMSVKRKSTIDRRTQELNKLVKDIHKNIVKKINQDIDQKIKENPKDKSTLNLSRPKHDVLPEDIALELNDRFAGRKTTDLISEDILLEIDKARNSVISLQNEMVGMDLLDTDIHLGTNEKGEHYVNRTYRKFDDKGWKDKIPQKVMNKAILVLRDLYNARDTNVESLANKKDNLIKSAQQKIEDRSTNLEEKKILVANTIGKIDKKIKVDSKNANIPTQDIDALKQRKEMLLNKIAKLESDTKTKNKKTEFYIKKAKKDLNNFLRDNKGNTEIDIDGHIEKDIQRFITSDPDAYSGNVSGESAKVVSSIFKSKSEFLNDNKALRDVMGEVNDPFINILNTAHKMITTIENYSSQKRMKDLGMDVLFSTKPSKKFNTELKTSGMPGLTEDGVLYTTPEFAESFKIMESTAPQVTNEVLKTIGNGLGWIKMGKTVMSTPAAINNYVSNIKHIATNGWNPAYALKNYVSLSKTAKIADIKDLLDRGILSQSIQGRELQDRKNVLIGGFSIKETVSRMPMLDVGAKLLGSLSDFHAKIFANGDNYAKYVGFYAEMSALRDIYPSWSEDQLRHEAAIIVSKISPTFDMVSPGIEKIRKSNVFSTFATFPAEQIRNRYNVGLLIKEDFKSGDKERIKRASRRLAGQLVGVGLSAALLGLSKYFIGAGYEKIKDLQIFQSQYSKNNAITYLSRNGDELEYIDLSRTDYDSYLLVAPLIGFVSGDYDKEKFENKLIRSTQALSSPFTDTNILTETMADVIYGRVLDTGDAIDSENDTFVEKLRKASKHAMSKLEPTNIKIARNWYDLATTGKDEYGGTITTKTAIMKTIGFGGKTLNITKQFTYHFYTIKAQNDDDKNKFERSYNNARTDEEKSKITERYTNQLVIGISKMSHLSRVAQQNSGNMKVISDLMNKLPKELKYAAAYGEMPEYKDTPIIQVGVDAYVNNVVQKLIYKK